MNQPETALAREALRKFLKINRYLHRYARQIDSSGMRPKDFSVLLFLREQGPATVSDVQEYLYNSPSTASTVISRLEAAGYVTRTRSEEDNRVVIVEITPAGQEVAVTTPLGGIPLLRRRLAGLPAERLKRIDEALGDIMELMEVPDDE